MGAELVYVQAPNDDRRVVLAESDPAHPDGEIFVVGDGRVVKVAMTQAVAAKVATGALVIVPGPQKKGKKDEQLPPPDLSAAGTGGPVDPGATGAVA